jgi:di/tripeptidase
MGLKDSDILLERIKRCVSVVKETDRKKNVAPWIAHQMEEIESLLDMLERQINEK